MRVSEYSRKTKETDITVKVNLDGTGAYALDLSLGFLSHMLNAFCRFSLIDLSGSLWGDLEVDDHHSVEDFGFCLGQALKGALGDMRGIYRSGFAYFPMDEALTRAVIDFSGRPFCVLRGKKRLKGAKGFTRELFEEFLQGLCRGANCTLHVDLLRGKNAHHVYESAFKALGRAIGAALAYQRGAEGILPSTKGQIDGLKPEGIKTDAVKQKGLC
jgi:imidazoleglycerol-phosphate dehydratase